MSRTMPLTGTLLLVVAVVAGHLGCDRQPPSAGSSSSTTTSPSADAQVKAVTVPVEGMSCAACAASVRKTVSAIDGVSDVEVDLEHRQAKVRYAPENTSPQQIAGAIAKLGYKAGEPTVEAAK